MLELLFEGDVGILTCVDSSIEAQLGNAELWDIHRLFEERYPNDKVYLMLGSSTLDWYVDQVKSSAVCPAQWIIVNQRDAKYAVRPNDIPGCSVHVIGSQYQSASSTVVRECVRNGLSSDLLPEKLDRYIRENGLYILGGARVPTRVFTTKKCVTKKSGAIFG